MKPRDLFFALGLFTLLLVAFSVSMTTQLFRLSLENRNINFLVIGVDSADLMHRGDSVLLLSYNPVSHISDLVSIPRDSLIFKELSYENRELSGKQSRRKTVNVRGMKITELFAYYFRKQNNYYYAGREFKSDLEKMFQMTIRHSVILDYGGVMKIIDLLGGVPVRITRPMHYDDSWGNLHIHFDTGTYVLDGKKSVEYLRYRDDRGDLNRIMRQQEYLRSLISKTKNPFLSLKLPVFAKTVYSSLHTDMDLSDIVFCFLEIRNMEKENIRFRILQGVPVKRGRIDYLKIDAAKLEDLKNILNEKTLQAEPSTGSVITAELWNATAHSHLARKVGDLLRKNAVDVVKWGNYGTMEDRTIVFDRVGNFKNALTAGKALNISNCVTRLDRSRYVDLTIIIGNDFDLNMAKTGGVR